MLADAGALHDARRYDGSAYLSGYAIEASLKSVLLLEALAHAATARTLSDLARALAQSGSATGILGSSANTVIRAFRQQVSHDTNKVVLALLQKRGTVIRLPLICSGLTRRYLSQGWPSMTAHLNWHPEHRYRAPGRVTAQSRADNSIMRPLWYLE